MIHCEGNARDDRELLRDLMDSFRNTPHALPDKRKTAELCRGEVESAVKELIARGEGAVDYGSSGANEQFNYYEQHKERFVETLARIPLAAADETVLEVGSLGLFSVLLKKVLGYTAITGLDRRPEQPAMIRATTSIMGKCYTQDILNVDLNKIPDSLPEGKFDKIFCFEVLEHLWFPVRVLAAFRRMLKPGGKLFLSVPNCASAMSLRKMLAMQVPMVWNAFDDTLEKAHFREYTPLSLKYVLAHAGFEELAFDTLYTASSVGDFHPVVQDMYPFPKEKNLNKLLQGDTLFSVSRPTLTERESYPDMLYNTGAFQESYYGEFPETVSLDYYFSKEWLLRNADFNVDAKNSLALPAGGDRQSFKARLKTALKACLDLFPIVVQNIVKSFYHGLRRRDR